MSYNTRRGGGNFNKGISASQVGQRRSGGPNHFNQNPRTPNAQQQMAKQQQMLVQKKQQQSQQQKQVQQKNQTLQQKQQANQKQQEEELKKKKELELQKQKELELQKQKESELQKQKELELQKQKELELQKQKELELLKQKELELQKQKELELEKQKALELQKQKDAELQRQKELALNELKEQEMLNKKELDSQKQPQQEEQLQTDADAEGMEVDNEGDNADLEAPQPPTISGQGTEGRPFRRRFPQRNRKLSKYEIQRRRNQRLSKLLQPKSAMVILNEVGKNVTYNVERSQTKTGPKGYMFKATLVVDDTTHEGHGLSKSSAKNEAAEKALRFLVKHKKLIQTVTGEPSSAANPPAEVEESMDTSATTEQLVDTPLAWQQLASFAIYKLLDSWGEDLEMVKEENKVDKKPVKKFSAELVNPLMLINQMLPRVNFEEMPRTSVGSTNTFNFRAIVDGKTFTGSGVSKKVAKRAVAFAICNEVLGIYYPPHIYTPPPSTEEPAKAEAAEVNLTSV
ncbi:intersectin-2-like isoform X2 [Harmonia axyridis]|uniref:intersectin-2-like isoform X2 n=1 Tax=Harmonia axyridis TaxID=115357 RepID=UPI001E27516A|nr:intersectin-2-like isoform X2 [Harmonia axyridis]